MASLNIQGKLELMKQTTEIVKAAASTEKGRTNESLLELLEIVYKKMLQLVEKDAPAK